MQKLIVNKGKATYVDLTPEEETARLLEIEQAKPSPEQVAAEAAVRDAPVGAKAWFSSNPSAKLIWSMNAADLAAEIASLVDTSFPSLSAANRMRWKLLLTAVALVVRIWVKREGLD